MNLRSAILVACLLQFSVVAAVDGQSRPLSVSAGIELDALPYITGGYFGAAWVGTGHIRGRALIAKVNMPEFFVADGFTNNDVLSFAVLADYYLADDWTGPWIAAGAVLWDSSIQSDARVETAKYRSYLLNGSIGYALQLYRSIYVSPWAGLSLRVAGDSDIRVDGLSFEPRVLNPEASVKFGWVFR